MALRDLQPEITVEEMDTVALKVIQATGVGARLHLGRSVFAARFWRAFGVLLAENRSILHRFGARGETIDHRIYDVDDDVDLISTCLDSIDVVLAASREVCDVDRRRFRTDEHKWHVAVMSELERIFDVHGS